VSPPDDAVSAPVYLAFESDLLVIERVAKRLFTEERLKNGDEYRDLAQALSAATKRIRDWEVSKKTADIVVAAESAKEKP
jgi:hypothetical protein